MPTPAGMVVPKSPQLFVARSAPAMLVMVPPVPAEPLPVTARCPVEPVLRRTIPLLPPLAEILWKVILLEPIVVLEIVNAVPVPEEIVFPVPVTLIVPPPVAVKPAPVVVVISKPLPPPAGLKLMVLPVLVLELNAALAVVVRAIVGLLKFTVPPPQLETAIPEPV